MATARVIFKIIFSDRRLKVSMLLKMITEKTIRNVAKTVFLIWVKTDRSNLVLAKCQTIKELELIIRLAINAPFRP